MPSTRPLFSIFHCTLAHPLLRNGQYARQLRKWGSKKYHRATDWDHVARTINHRSRQGKSSIVFIDNDRIPSPKVRKEIGRIPLSRLQVIGRSPMPIDSIEIRTPPKSPQEESTTQTELLPPGTLSWTQLLPSSKLEVHHGEPKHLSSEHVAPSVADPRSKHMTELPSGIVISPVISF